MRLRKTTTLAAGLLAMTALLGVSGMTRADKVDDYLKAEMAKRHIPGLSVAVVQDGKVVKEQGYGLANVELSVPATVDTVYMLASISKQFTATGIMLLVRDGKVGLDDGAGKYLDGLPKTWRGVTVRQLLNQISGIPEWVPNPNKDPLLKTYTLAEITRRAAAKPLAFTPGSRFEYSNTNYNLLAGIIEKASGSPCGEFLRARIFGPLGMSATGPYDPMEIVGNRAAGYIRLGGKLFNNTLVYDPSLFSGAGGLQSTVGDMVKWDAALAAGTLLPASDLAQMWTPPALPNGAHSGYGMGWVNQRLNGHRVLWHNGSLPGAMGFSGLFPEDHLTVILLSNMSPLDGFDEAYPFLPLGQGVAALYIPALAPAQEVEVPVLESGPQTDALLRRVSDQLAKNKLDLSLFAPSMQAILTPSATGPAHALLAPLGKMTALTLTRTAPDGSALYRAVYGRTVVDWLITVDKNHKIIGLRPLPE